MIHLVSLNDEQRLILETLEKAAQSVNKFEDRRRRLRADPPDRMALWQPMAELGALGLCYDEALGGFGGSPRDMALLPAAIGANLPVEPLVTCGVTTARLLAPSGAAAGALIEDSISGQRIVVPALFEDFYTFGSPATVAKKDGDDWRLTGTKPAVRHADVATDFLVSAKTEDGNAILLLCSASAEGLERKTFRLVDEAGGADLEFRDVAATALMLEPLDVDVAITDAIDWTLAALCVETAAICETSNRQTFAYLGERKQFGQPLANFQALQFKAADMHVAATEAAAAAESALSALERPVSSARSAAILSASLACDRASRTCGHGAVQLHGGMGVSDELNISHFARRLAAIRAQIGTTDVRATRLETLKAQDEAA